MYKKQHIHFIGIGGIGMSGIAKILKLQDHTISGCDSDMDQQSIHELEALGCTIYPKNNHENCINSTVDIVVYTTVIKPNNPEIISAKSHNIKVIHRSVILAELMRNKFSIAVTGSHGKTTTTSLVSHLLIEAELDPTIVVGGHLKNINTNATCGTGKFLVAEADESDRSFLNLFPTLEVITNISLEHLETYSDLEDIKSTYLKFFDRLPFYGKAIVCIEDQNLRSILPLTTASTIKYGFDASLADVYAYNINLQPNYSTFNISLFEEPIYLNIPGKHNILNSLAAICIAHEIGINKDHIIKALKTFNGVERRFNLVGEYKGTEFFDDYGHHPIEIANMLPVAKNRAKNRLIVVFQPHKYSRTHKLWQEFITVFSRPEIDKLFITDIFAASEEPIENVSGVTLVEAIKSNSYVNANYISYDNNLTMLKESLEKEIAPGDLVLLLGAGKINKLIDKF